MKSCKTSKEKLCETDEKGEKLFTQNELSENSMLISQRILEIFYFAADKEIAFLLHTHIDNIRAFTERGEFPSTELLLAIHKVTGVSMDWILTGNGVKNSNSTRLPMPSVESAFNNIVSAQTF